MFVLSANDLPLYRAIYGLAGGFIGVILSFYIHAISTFKTVVVQPMMGKKSRDTR